MIFGYTVTQAKKAVVSALWLALAVVGLFVAYSPGFDQAVVVLGGAVVATVGTFLTKNHTPDDVDKALTHLQGAALAVVGFFATVNPSVAAKITVLIGAVVSAYTVYLARNEAT